MITHLTLHGGFERRTRTDYHPAPPLIDLPVIEATLPSLHIGVGVGEPVDHHLVPPFFEPPRVQPARPSLDKVVGELTGASCERVAVRDGSTPSAIARIVCEEPVAFESVAPR